MVAPVIVLLAFVVSWSHAAVDDIYDCTHNNGTDLVYSRSATACENKISDVTCQTLYVKTAGGYPETDKAHGRPFNCYNADHNYGVPPVPSIVKDAIANCPKTCGFCCLTSEYNCRNVQFPRLNCDTITDTQCRSIEWRTIIAEDCPSACGMCDEGGCVDGAIECANDPSICNNIGLQDFVNVYCQRTCGRCSTSTTRAPAAVLGACQSYIADSSASCRAWAANGFCNNNFYTVAQRRNYCATTCRIC